MAKPQLKNSKVNLMHSLNSGHSYSASAWIQTADGPNMSDEEKKLVESMTRFMDSMASENIEEDDE